VAASLVSGVWLLCGAAGCILLMLVIDRVGRDGLGELVGDQPLLPAVAFLGLVGVGAILGARSLRGQVLASRELERRVSELALPRPDALDAAAARSGLSGRLVLVDSDEPFSFAYGAITPRVAVSRGLYECAAPGELDAVLAHEAYHVYNLDPLKVLLARGLPAMFFYLPILRDLHHRYLAGRELAADRRAVHAHGMRPLAAALFNVVRGPAWPELATAAAIGGPELLDVRIAQLERGDEPKLGIVTGRHLALSLAGLAVLLVSFVAAIALAGGPVAVADDTGMSVTPVGVLLALMCAVPIAVAGWVIHDWLARRTRRPPAQETLLRR
jgi:beta-lactamase regulating signal transducer with metallopeptidase domain